MYSKSQNHEDFEEKLSFQLFKKSAKKPKQGKNPHGSNDLDVYLGPDLRSTFGFQIQDPHQDPKATSLIRIRI